MNHKLIVFDWNGTILSDARASWLAGNECLKFYGAPPLSYDDYRHHFMFPILHFYKKCGLCVDHVLKHKEKANEVFQSSYEELSKNARTRRGARLLLQHLKEQNINAIILSNYRTEKIAQHLDRLKLNNHISTILAHECDGTTILERTSKEQRLSHYMAKRNYNPNNVIIIGDSTEEPDVARKLGLSSIGITDGYITEKRLRAANPDYIVHSLKEVMPIINSHWQS